MRLLERVGCSCGAQLAKQIARHLLFALVSGAQLFEGHSVHPWVIAQAHAAQ
jgi:hypothetical protein